jgi:hypothetical protein
MLARMTKRLLANAGAAFAALAILAITSPASAAPAAATSPAARTGAAAPAVGGVQTEDKWSAGATVLSHPTYWVYCHDTLRTAYIYLQYGHSTCGGTQDVIGFAFMTTNTGGSHSIEVCDSDSVAAGYVTEIVNPANSDGTASGQTIWYTDYPDDFSCLVRTLSYPIRKFQATADNQGYSAWLLPR